MADDEFVKYIRSKNDYRGNRVDGVEYNNCVVNEMELNRNCGLDSNFGALFCSEQIDCPWCNRYDGHYDICPQSTHFNKSRRESRNNVSKRKKHVFKLE